MSEDLAPKVSVVIPAYNAADFIEATLDTVRAQTFRDYEVVVTDDGSADATQAVVEGYLRRHALRGRCIRQENKKIAAARNTAMRASRGDFIAFLDHARGHAYQPSFQPSFDHRSRRPGEPADGSGRQLDCV